MEITLLVISIIGIMYINYKGLNLFVSVPLFILLISIFTFDFDIIFFRMSTYLESLLNFIIPNFVLFYLGTIFGDYLAETKLAHSMAESIINRAGKKFTILALIIFVSILLMGGISAFVVVYALYPIASNILYQLNIPKRHMMSVIGVGMATYMIGSLPGSPQIHNILPTLYFDTNLYAAPFLGIITSVYFLVSGYIYISYQVNKSNKKGEGYGEVLVEENAIKTQHKLPFTPILVVLITYPMISNLPYEFFRNQVYAVSLALLFGILSANILVKDYKNHRVILMFGIKKAMKPLLFVGSMIAFGTVISTFDFVESIKSILSNQHPFITITLSNYVFSAISGSMSGAVSITLSLFSNEILASAAELGISHDLLHRVTTLSGITFDTLPTNGTTVSILYITGLKFKEIYKDYFFITVLNPFIVSLLVLFILLI